MEITGGEGVKCVIDGVGKATYEIALNSLATRGIFVSFGPLARWVPARRPPGLRHPCNCSVLDHRQLSA